MGSSRLSEAIHSNIFHTGASDVKRGASEVRRGMTEVKRSASEVRRGGDSQGAMVSDVGGYKNGSVEAFGASDDRVAGIPRGVPVAEPSPLWASEVMRLKITIAGLHSFVCELDLFLNKPKLLESTSSAGTGTATGVGTGSATHSRVSSTGNDSPYSERFIRLCRKRFTCVLSVLFVHAKTLITDIHNSLSPHSSSLDTNSISGGANNRVGENRYSHLSGETEKDGTHLKRGLVSLNSSANSTSFTLNVVVVEACVALLSRLTHLISPAKLREIVLRRAKPLGDEGWDQGVQSHSGGQGHHRWGEGDYRTLMGDSDIRDLQRVMLDAHPSMRRGSSLLSSLCTAITALPQSAVVVNTPMRVPVHLTQPPQGTSFRGDVGDVVGVREVNRGVRRHPVWSKVRVGESGGELGGGRRGGESNRELGGGRVQVVGMSWVGWMSAMLGGELEAMLTGA
eukprot:GHVN01095877.1.p1 GENE.GHVN01095877.1~~GHVN01095877.1.p1  ORF type:complete len:520 (-),score=169.70 GHVN01095877.1:41-1399(-)